MPRSEPHGGTLAKGCDWRSWVLLAWALGFGLLYGKMVLEQRAPGLLARLQHASGLAVTKHDLSR